MRQTHKDSQQALRSHLLELLDGQSAHLSLESLLRGFPADLRGKRHPKLPYTPWQLVEHMRITQLDIVEYCLNPDHQSPAWPDDYWPNEEAPPTEAAWRSSMRNYRSDRRSMVSIVSDPRQDLLKHLHPHTEHTLAREAMVLAQHTSYHTGQLALLKRLLGLAAG